MIGPSSRKLRSDLSMTFGLEIEMMVASAAPLPAVSGEQPPFEDPHPDDHRDLPMCSTDVQNQDKSEMWVCEILHDYVGIDNVYMEDDYTHRRPSEKANTSRAMLPKIPEQYHYWRTMKDNSLAIEKWVATDPVLSRYSWSGVEIASAVQRSWAKNSNYWICVNKEQKAQIRKICGELSSNLRLRFSDSCGLHVHLGLGGEGIPENTIRRFLTTIWIIEDAILTLCAPWRETNEHAKPITRYSDLARDVGPKGESLRAAMADRMAKPSHFEMFLSRDTWDKLSPTQQEQIQLIWSLPVRGNHPNDLIGAHMISDSRGSVAVRSAIQGEYIENRTTPNTIEIRYASGTLVPAELVSWTNLFMRLFQLCNWYDDTNAIRLAVVLEAVVYGCVWRDRWGAEELLRAIGLRRDIKIWDAAAARWAVEDDPDQVRKSPFVADQYKR